MWELQIPYPTLANRKFGRMGVCGLGLLPKRTRKHPTNPAAIGLQFFVYNYPFFLLNNQYAAKIRQLFENQTFFLLKSVSVPAFGRVLTRHLAGF